MISTVGHGTSRHAQTSVDNALTWVYVHRPKKQALVTSLMDNGNRWTMDNNANNNQTLVQQPPSLIPERNEVRLVPDFRDLTIMGFGSPGSGKTRFFAGDKDAIFASTEPGQDWVGSRVVPIRTWVTFKNLVLELSQRRKAGNIDCSGVIIDIVDNLYQMCLQDVCSKSGVTHPNEKKGDFGFLWSKITKEWTDWIRALMGITNIHFITHALKSTAEVANEHGLLEEITHYGPTFSGSKPAQYLDGIVNAVGFFSKSKDGHHILTFKQEASIAAKDRTDILGSFGPIKLPKADHGFEYIRKIYQHRAVELGYQIIERKI